MDTLSEQAIVMVTKKQVSCELAGEAVILHLESGVYYGLNPVGARVWDLLQEPTTVDNLCNILLTEYDVETERCQDDLQALLQDMLDNKLIEIKNGQAS